MKFLLDLTLRGTLMFGVVTVLDHLFAGRVSARTRRAWWLLIPAAFLFTITLPLLPSPAARPLRWWSRVAPAQHLDVVVATSAASFHAAVPRLHAAVPLPRANWNWPLIVLLAGASGDLLVVVGRTSLALRRWSRERLCTDPDLLNLLEDCKRDTAVTAPIGLVVTAAVATPVILGWLRPRILLPAGLVTTLSPAQLRGVLFHELAHFRHLDVPLNWLFTLVCALHWFNPAAHLAVRGWTRFCEEAADEAAIAALREPSSLAYGETLLQVLKQTNQPHPPYAALAIVESVGQLRKRLLMIKHYPQKSTHSLLTAAVFLLAASGILLRPLHAADTPWGKVIDPEGDCKLSFENGKLYCSIPGKDHALSSEVHRVTAPRVLQEVTGDFSVQVKVSGDYPTKVTSAVPEFAPWQGAGLLVWWDMANYVRFERAQLTLQGRTFDYASFEVRQNGQVLEYANAEAHPVEGKSTYLKLERHGDKLTGSFSADGADWTPLLPTELKWPQALRVGVSASQDTTTPLNVQFEDYKLTPAAAPVPAPAMSGEGKSATHSLPATLPFDLPTGIAGIKKGFLGRDAIEIKAVTGTAPTFQVGETYRVTGVCRQETVRHALLYVGNTASPGADAITPAAGSALTKALPTGSTNFDCTFELRRPGALHVTIYDLDNPDRHDNAYAGVDLGEVVFDR